MSTAGDWNDNPFRADQPPPLELLDFTTLQDREVPEQRWFVRDWVPWARVTGMFGAGGEGKTLLGQQLMTAAAIKQSWLGRGVSPVKSLGLFCEDDADDLHRRQADINRLYGCAFSDLKDIKALPRLGCDNLLMTFQDGRPLLSPLWQQLLEQALILGTQLIFIDTIADTFGGNHNDPGQARMFVQMGLGGLARAIDGIVIASGHPSRTGQSSGSGEFGTVQWDATFRSRLYLKTNNATDSYARTLTRMKANYALRDETIPMRWKDGVFINTDLAGIIGTIQRRTAERVFLDLLDRVTAEGRHVSENTHAPNYAPRLFAERPDGEGFTKADFRKAMEALFARSIIIVTTYQGSNRHEHEEIGRNPNVGARSALGSL